jgi:hypothetical protein
MGVLAMGEPNNINDFAEMYSMDVGAVMLAVIKYLVSDPRDISPAVRNVLLSVGDDEIEEALETIADDLKSTGSKEAVL